MIALVPYDVRYLRKSLKWLNDPEIRELIDVHGDVNHEMQEKWFADISEDPTYQIWGVEQEGMPIGACGIKHIDYNKRKGEYWGYIGEKEYWGGKGHDLMHLVYEKASEFKLEELYLYVLKTNIRAQQLYVREGFTVHNEDNDILCMHKTINKS